MPDVITTNYSFTLPEEHASDDTWGAKLNQNWDDLDAILFGFSGSITGLGNVLGLTDADVTALEGTVLALDNATLKLAQNLNDVPNKTTARANLQVPRAYASQSAPTSGDGVNGDLWFQY